MISFMIILTKRWLITLIGWIFADWLGNVGISAYNDPYNQFRIIVLPFLLALFLAVFEFAVSKYGSNDEEDEEEING